MVCPSVPTTFDRGTPRELPSTADLKRAHFASLRNGHRGLTYRHLKSAIECGQFSFEKIMAFLVEMDRLDEARRFHETHYPSKMKSLSSRSVFA